MSQIAFNVSITNNSAVGTGSGFIDNARITSYLNTTYTEANALDKKRANLRYTQILEALGMVANPTVISVQAVGATQNTPASQFSMQVSFPDGSMSIIRNSVQLNDADAIKQLIAESLSTDQTHLAEVYSPTCVATTMPVVVGAIASTATIAAGLITVSLA